MLTMVVAEGRWVGGGCDLRVVKVRNFQIAHGEPMCGVCDDVVEKKSWCGGIEF